MAVLIDPEDLLVQYAIPHRDPKAFEGIFRNVPSAKKIYIPPGDYELTRMLTITETVIIEGEGAGVSNLIYNGLGPAIILFFDSTVSTGSGIQNLTLKSTSPQSITSGIRVDSSELSVGVHSYVWTLDTSNTTTTLYVDGKLIGTANIAGTETNMTDIWFGSLLSTGILNGSVSTFAFLRGGIITDEQAADLHAWAKVEYDLPQNLGRRVERKITLATN